MRRLSRFLTLALLALAGLGWSLAARAASDADGGAVHVTQAEMTAAVVDGFSPPATLLTPGSAQGTWTPVRLPHATPKLAHAAANKVISAWFREPLALPASSQPTYLYLPRWQAVGHIAIYADGRLVYAPDTSAKWNGFNQPLWIEIAGPSTPPPHQILIHVQGQARSGFALSSFWVGPRDGLSMRHQTRVFLQITAPAWGCAVFMIVGLIAFAVWIRRRQEPAYLLIFGVAILVTLHSLEYFIGTGRLPISDNAFQWIESNSEFWHNVVIFVMVSYYIGGRTAWMRRLSIGLGVLFSLWTTSLAVAAIPLESVLGIIWTLGLATNVICIVVAWLGYRAAPTRIGFLFCVFNTLILPAGLIDIAMSQFKLSNEGVYAVPYVPVMEAALFLYIMIDRHLAALGDAEKARVDLAVRLRDREAELAETYDKLRESQQRQMLVNERQRLMRDMHDGVGSSLMGALVVVERGEADAQATAQMLRDCLDDLKLAIDSLEPVDSDLLLLLATARYRLEPRFEQAGVKLIWTVGDLPALPKITPEHALHILRIVQEVFTNIVKHAKAKEVRLSVTAQGDEVVIDIVDDGVGFDAAAATAPGGGHAKRRGLANLAARAAAMDASIAWTSAPGRTCVELRMPLAVASTG
jgi:signal transduction histidine kinase